MTTTLRPTAPEQGLADGGRERAYAICVNGRPVGGVVVRGYADGVGEIAELQVEAEGRGRGRGTTAVLAAEEILRGWGCSRAEAAITAAPGGTPERLLRFAETLGYRLAARNMVKELPETAPALPDGLTSRPLAAADFPAWLANEAAGYVRMLVGHSGLTPEQAEAKSAADHAQLFAQGAQTPGMVITQLLAADEVVGAIWVRTEPSEARPAWVFDVEVREGARGLGYGRALMLLGEGVTLAAGERRLGLNVHAGNVPAERLYESLGYRTFRWAYAKQL